MKAKNISLYLIYAHAFFLSVGTDTISFVILGTPIFDILLIIYVLLNFKSISLSIYDIRDVLFA